MRADDGKRVAAGPFGGERIDGVAAVGGLGSFASGRPGLYAAAMSLPEPLSRQFERAVKHRLCEADAQRVIIEPLLAWLGYDIYDLEQVTEQVSVEGAGRGTSAGAIDYALRVAGRTYALVEAKAPVANLRDLLDDRAAVQQINAYCYSHPDRPRWGVLTNGFLWVIYDAQAAGEVFKRVILTVDVASEPDLLRALSPAWSAHLTRFADLLCEARTVTSETIRERAMRDIHREYRETFSGPTPASPLSPPVPPRPEQVAPTVAPPPREAGAREAARPARRTVAPTAPPSLAARGNEPAQPSRQATATCHHPPESHGKPRLLLLSSGRFEVRSWADVVVFTAEHVIRRGRALHAFRLPWTTRTIIGMAGEVAFLKPRVLSNGASIETNWSAQNCVRIAGALLAHAGENTDTLSVQYEIASRPGVAAP